MIWRMVEYHGMITRKYKLEIYHIVVDLDDSNSNIITELDEKFIFRGFKIIKLHDIDYSRIYQDFVTCKI
jgi:hypothetical protein